MNVYINPELEPILEGLVEEHAVPVGRLVHELVKAGIDVADFKRIKADFHEALKPKVQVTPRRRFVREEHLSQFWYGVLQGLEPVGAGHSLHVAELQYKIGTKKYLAIWELGKNSDVPFVIREEE